MIIHVGVEFNPHTCISKMCPDVYFIRRDSLKSQRIYVQTYLKTHKHTIHFVSATAL